MRITRVVLASLVPYLHAASSMSEFIRQLPVEIRDHVYQYLPLQELVEYNNELRKDHPDILPTNSIKKKAIFEQAMICGKRLPWKDSYGYQNMKNQNDIDCEELAAGLQSFYLELPNDVSFLENFLLQLSTVEDDTIFVGVARAIAKLPSLIEALAHLSTETYAKFMPRIIRALQKEDLPFDLDHVITDQLILDNPTIFSFGRNYTARIDKFVEDILKTDNVEACRVVISNPDSKFILYRLESKMIVGQAHEAAIFVFSYKISQSYKKGKNPIEEIKKFGFLRPDILVRLIKENEDILPLTVARDILLEAVEERSLEAVIEILTSKDFDLVLDHEIVLLALEEFIMDYPAPVSVNLRKSRYAEVENSPSHKVLEYIIEQAMLSEVDLSANENILLAKAISCDFPPLIESLTIDPQVRAVGLTEQMESAIRREASEMSFSSAKAIVRAFGAGRSKITKFFWKTDEFKSIVNRRLMIYEALDLLEEEECECDESELNIQENDENVEDHFVSTSEEYEEDADDVDEENEENGEDYSGSNSKENEENFGETVDE